MERRGLLLHPKKWWGDCRPYSHISAPSRSPSPPQVLGLHYFYAITEFGGAGKGPVEPRPLPGSPDPALGSWSGRGDNSCPPLRPRDGYGGAGEVPWTIQGARGWGGDGPSPPLPHFQCCLDLCLGRGSEGAQAPALRRLRAMRLIPDLVYFCKTWTSSHPTPLPGIREGI